MLSFDLKGLHVECHCNFLNDAPLGSNSGLLFRRLLKLRLAIVRHKVTKAEIKITLLSLFSALVSLCLLWLGPPSVSDALSRNPKLETRNCFWNLRSTPMLQVEFSANAEKAARDKAKTPVIQGIPSGTQRAAVQACT